MREQRNEWTTSSWRAAVALAGATAVVALVASGCRRPHGTPGPAADIVPSVSLTSDVVPAGDVVAVTYHWKTGPSFQRLAGDYTAFVHALDAENTMLFTDDHAPSPRTSEWEPSHEYRYTRVLFAPHYVAGRLTFRLGLYRQSQRLGLRATDVGGQEYAVGSVMVRPRSEPAVKFGPEWSRPESFAGDAFRPMRWLERPSGTIGVRNPWQDAVLLLAVRGVAALVGTWPALRVDVGSQTRTFPIETHEIETFKMRVPRAAWGTAEWSAVEMAVLRDAGDANSRVVDPGRSLVLHGIAVQAAAEAAPELLDGSVGSSGGPVAQ